MKFTDIRTEDSVNKGVPFKISTLVEETGKLLPGSEKLLFKNFGIDLKALKYEKKETIEILCKSQKKDVEQVLNILNKEYQKKYALSISCEELQMMIEDRAPVNILDVREQWECDIAKINNSQRITPNNNENILSQIEKEELLVIVDWNGDRGSSFQQWLFQKGFKNMLRFFFINIYFSFF